MKELWLRLLTRLGMAYWVEIVTVNPRCIYYFGPFASRTGAEQAQLGYLDDLKAEGAQDIKVKVKRCKPTILTILQEPEEPSPIFSQWLASRS